MSALKTTVTLSAALGLLLTAGYLGSSAGYGEEPIGEKSNASATAGKALAGSKPANPSTRKLPLLVQSRPANPSTKTPLPPGRMLPSPSRHTMGRIPIGAPLSMDRSFL
jgi:hypothetical protein